jgi:hypothetical protein
MPSVLLVNETEIAILYWVTLLIIDPKILSQPQFLLYLPPEAPQVQVILAILLAFHAVKVHFEVFEKLMLVFGEIPAM